VTTHARWLRFNAVGIAGFAVQMVVLAVLAPQLPLAAAVTLAVAAAATHNFAWHERVTWPGLPATSRWRRWLAFLGTTGLISVAANIAVTTGVTALGVPVLAANSVAVAVASTANYFVSDRVVFHQREA
jgi:putative flippase GtrA